MITINDLGEIHCTNTTCSREFCEGEICYAGLYQCPHNIERAKACLLDAIDELEDFKSRNKKYEHNDEYYKNLAHLEDRVNKYRRFLEQ